MSVKVGLLGHKGRMGEWVTKLLSTEFQEKALLHTKADQGDSLEPLLSCDVVIDFSAPAAALSLGKLALAKTAQLPAFVVGSTGWKIDERRVLEDLAQKTPVLMSSNFSTGVLAILDILRSATPVLEKLGYTPVIVEAHHKHKKDAPSGTALSLQRAISPAGPGNVQTHSIRAGEVVGDHEVNFFGAGDTVTLRHHAQDRSIFARGAIQAGLWLAGKRSSLPTGKLIGIETYFKELTQTHV